MRGTLAISRRFRVPPAAGPPAAVISAGAARRAEPKQGNTGIRPLAPLPDPPPRPGRHCCRADYLGLYSSPATAGEVGERSEVDGGVAPGRRTLLCGSARLATRQPHLASPSEEGEESGSSRDSFMRKLCLSFPHYFLYWLSGTLHEYWSFLPWPSRSPCAGPSRFRPFRSSRPGRSPAAAGLPPPAPTIQGRRGGAAARHRPLGQPPAERAGAEAHDRT